MKKLIALLASCLLLAGVTQAQVTRTQMDVEKAIKIVKGDKDVKNRVDALGRLAEAALVRTALVKPAIPVLVEAMADPSVEVRRAAANVLGLANQEHKTVAPVLIKALDKKEDRNVRLAAVVALNTFGPHAADAVLVLAEIQKELNGMDQKERDNQLLQAVNQALATIQASFKEQADRIIAMLRANPDAEVRIKSIDEVAKLAKTHPAFATQAYNALVDAWIKDRDNDVRKAVQEWVRTMKPEPKVILTPLIQILSNPQEDKLNRLAAATMLGGMRGEAKEAIPALTALKDKEQDKDVVRAVTFALRGIQGAAEEKQ